MSNQSHVQRLEQRITNQQQLINELNQEIFQLKSIIDNLPGDVYWKHCKKDKLVYAGLNRTGRESLKKMGFTWAMDDIQGKTDYDLFDHATAEDFIHNDWDVITNRTTNTKEEMATLPSGEQIIQLSTKRPLFNQQGETIGIVGISLDITEFKKLEAALQAAKESQFYRIVDAVPASIYWKDKDGYYLGCNKYMLKMAGLNQLEDIIGKRDNQLVWKESADELFKIDNHVILNKTTLEIEETPILANKQQRIFLTTKTPLYTNMGEVIGLIGVSLDITERKKLEDELRIALEKVQASDKAKSEFLQNMSHDFRNPLSGIIYSAQALMIAPEQAQEFAPMIQLSAEKLLDLCNGVLELISAEGVNESDIKNETFDLRKVAQDLQGLLQPSVKSKGIQFILDLDPNIPSYLENDRIKIERILLNLISNAIKFTHQGKVTLKIQVIDSRYGNGSKEDQIQFSVIDTGIGIAADKLHRIFERFFKAHPSYEEIYKGYGVGLNIVKQYVTLLGGEVTVQSELNQGTTFNFALWFPVKSATNFKPSTETILKPEAVRNILSKQDQQPKEEKPTQSLTQGQKILFVDDDFGLRKTIQMILSKYHYSVTTVTNISEALAALEQEEFALLMTDLGLGNENGLDLVQRYRQIEQQTGKKRKPIFVLTGHGTKTPESLAAGADQVLTKPASSEQLHAAIQAALVDAESEGDERSIQDPNALFDAERARSFLGEEIGELLLLFWLTQSLPEERTGLNAAYQEKDWNKIQHYAHKLKGSSAYAGALRLYQACKALEDQLMFGGDLDPVVLFQKLLVCIDETEQVVKEWLEKQG